MREINIRDDSEPASNSEVRIRFGEDGELLKYNQGDDTFSVSDNDDNLYLWVRDLPMLKKALEKLEEFVVTVGDPDEEL